MLRPEDGRLSYIYIPIYRCIGPSGRSRRLVAYVRIFRYSCPRLYDWGTILWFRWIKLFLLVQGSRMFLGMFFISSLCYTRYMTFPVFPVWRVFSDDLIGLCFFFFFFFPRKLNTGHCLFILASFQGLSPFSCNLSRVAAFYITV